tara:strand:- start:101 stop:994 length:894 start_codon:yes stop_codon:yes gene_type:complete
MANATSSQLQQLYISYFSRPADPEGLDYWTHEGITTKAFAANMYLQPEFKSINGSLSIRNQLNNIYQNLFSRDGDEEGLDYWTKEIQTGKLVLASIANDYIYAVNNSRGGTEEVILQRANDLACLSNKTNAALVFTQKAKSLIPESLLQVVPPILYKSTYEPESMDPWIDGRIFENVKEWMSNICKKGIPEITAEELLEGGYKQLGDPLISPVASQIQELIFNDQDNNESNYTELNEISNLECGCNKQLDSLSTDISQYSSLVNTNIDSLEDHSPYGLTSSNNIVVESLVSIDNPLF